MGGSDGVLLRSIELVLMLMLLFDATTFVAVDETQLPVAKNMIFGMKRMIVCIR